MKKVVAAQDYQYHQIARHNLAMRRLVSAVQELSLARSLDTIKSVVRHAARELTGSDGATFVLREGENCYYADEEAIAPLWKGQRFPMTACISGWCMLHREAATIPDVYADPRIPADVYRKTFVKSLVMVPIRSSKPIGAIGNYWADSHTATADEVELIQALADTTAVAIDNVQLYSELESRVQLRTRQLELANQELEAFSYTVSHDLRGPLTQIRGYAELVDIAPGIAPSEKQVEYVGRIRSTTQRMAVLIDDLIRLTKVTRTELKIEKLDLSAMARGILTRLRGVEPARKVDLRIEDGLLVQGDRGLLQLALENLLSNAWKYSSKQEESRIEFGSTTQPDGSPAFLVRDNGVGFEMQLASKLFVPFQRLHAEAEFHGHGIGLATVQRIIQRHGGSIWVESAKGKGTTFYFTVPGGE
ncbi:MAG: GAF domain-containing protein [Acidobacteria bacterium]|nr:GAF domain-containing protein [Acidobacteriota bacterium]